VKLTVTLDQFMPDTFPIQESGKTPRSSNQKSSQTLTALLADSHVRLFRLQERDEVLQIQEDLCFLKSLGLQKRSDHNIFYLKTSKGYSITTKGGLLELSSPRCRNWGTMSNGRYLTANILFRKTESVSSLSDILEDSVEEKYFLSEKSVKSLMAHSERHQKAGHGFKANIAVRLRQPTGKDGVVTDSSSEKHPKDKMK